jgi:hypothetical protein
MLSDDVYRSQLQAAFANLKRVAAPLADVAHIDVAETPHFARLSLLPNAVGACAVEIMLRADQLYDIALSTEFYEDCPIERFDLFEPLITAVIRGDVLQRREISIATGTERAVETVVSLPGGVRWRKGHVHTKLAHAVADDATVFHDRRFVPYRR